MSRTFVAVVTTAWALATVPAVAAPRPLINYFQPMPIVGKLSTTVWGASAVGARDPANGLEDSGSSGGVGPQQETYFYWDGKILKGEDGKYHLYASRWLHSIGFGPPSGGSTGWQTSIPVEAISDNAMGPYVVQGNCYSKNQEGNNQGHNVTALWHRPGPARTRSPSVRSSPGRCSAPAPPTVPGRLLGLMKTNTNGHSACGTLSSNFTFTVGPDNRFWATSRAGCVMDSDQVLGTYKVETDSVLPNLENNANGNAEDEVIWYSGGYYHIVYNYWNVQRAYHIMSKDGVTKWTSTGLAYQASQSPANANSKWLRYTDGTVNQWHNMERPGVYQENGHVRYFTFAVTDVDKNASAVNNGGSKILVVPFDGVQFDCDNGDAASCAELGAGGAGGAGAGGAAGGGGRGGSGGGVGGSVRTWRWRRGRRRSDGRRRDRSIDRWRRRRKARHRGSERREQRRDGRLERRGGGDRWNDRRWDGRSRRQREWLRRSGRRHDRSRRRSDGRRFRESGHRGRHRGRRRVWMRDQSGQRRSPASGARVAGEHSRRCPPTVAAAGLGARSHHSSHPVGRPAFLEGMASDAAPFHRGPSARPLARLDIRVFKLGLPLASTSAIQLGTPARLDGRPAQGLSLMPG